MVCAGELCIPSPSVRDIPSLGSQSTERQNIEVWNDLVSLKDLVVSLLVSVVCAVLAVIVSSRAGGQTLFWGLGASVVGFTVNCLLVTPKREVSIVDETGSADDAGSGAQ